MPFLDHIEKIQKKPDHVRRKIVTVSTVAITGLIVSVWLTVANPLTSLTGNNDQQKLGYEPFSMLKDIKDTANAAGAAVGELKDGINGAKDYAELLKQQEEKQKQEDILTQKDLEEFLTGTTTLSFPTTTKENLNNYGQNQ